MVVVNTNAARYRADRRARNDFLFGCTALRGRLGLAILALSGIALSGPALALDATALPQGGHVTSGSATITQTAPAQLGISQHSDRAILDWNSFNIGASAGVNFQQPSSSAIAVNRVGGGTDPSQIMGTLTANGQVMILNPNGVLFGRGSHVDVAGLVASTGNIDDAAFMRGDTRLTLSGRSSGASVVNEGAITARDGGLVAMVAPSVANDGVIEARVGRVALAGASTVTLDLYGDQMIQIAVDGGSQAAGVLVANSGRIAADGGRVLLTAEAARGYVDQVINTSGVVRAQGVSVDGGAIVLNGGSNGTVTVAGTLDASTAQAGGTGGTIKVVGDRTALTDTAVLTASGDVQGGQIETSGHTLSIADGARVEAAAANGQNGTWLLDPASVNIASIGGDITPATIVTTLNTTNMVVQADNSITVSDIVDSSAQANANTLTFQDTTPGDGLTVNLNAKVNLGASQHLTGDGTTVNVGSNGKIQNGVDVSKSGATVNVAAGTYNDPNVNINKNNLTLAGASGAKIVVPDFAGQRNGINVNADGVTVSGFEIAGPVTSSYLTYNWGSNISRGIAVSNGSDNFAITNNNIHDVRNGILIDGRNAASTVTGNRIENTKGGISVQYTDGSTIGISGNSQGPIGNEWGVNLHLNGHLAGDGVTILSNSPPIASAPTLAWQQSLLAQSAANGGWSIQDQAYTSSNRTEVTVAATGSASNQGSPLHPLDTIQNGVNAVVTGGTVNVAAGTYAENLTIAKALTIDGAGIGQTTLQAASHWSGTAFTVNGASNVTLSDLTVSDYQYGLQINGTSNDMNVTRVAFAGDHYGVRTGTTTRADRFHMTDSSFSGGEMSVETFNNHVGAVATGSFADALFENVTINDPTYKGFYFETADNLTLRNVTINNAGNFGDPSSQQFGAAIDVNLKFDAYHAITFDNLVVTNSGHSSGDPSRAAVVVKTRGVPGDSSTYTADPASLQSMTITGGRIEGSAGTGIRFEDVSNGAGGRPTLTVSTSFANNGIDIQTDKANVNATGSTFTGATSDAQIEARLLHIVDDPARGRVTWTSIDPPPPPPPPPTPETFLPPAVTITNALPPAPPAPPAPPPPQVTPPPPAQVVATVPPALLLTIVAPAAGGIPGIGGAPPPQVIVTNNTTGVGGALAGGNAVVLDLSGSGPSYSQTASLTTTPPPPPQSGGSPGGSSSQSGGSSSQAGGSSDGSSPQNQSGNAQGSQKNDGSE